MCPRPHAEYLRAALDPEERARLIDKAVNVLVKHLNDFDMIAFTGLSGALVAPSIADAFMRPVVAVRKPTDMKAHSVHRVETAAPFDDTRAVFVDDFVSSGSTLRDVVGVLRVHGMRVVGVYEYYFGLYNREGVEAELRRGG